MGFMDSGFQIGVEEVIVPDPQAVAGLPGVYGIRTEGKGVAHVFQCPRWGQEFNGHT